MQRVILDIEDSKFEQFIAMIDLLKSDVVKKFQVQKTDDEYIAELKNDPLAQELERRIKEIDDGTAELIPHADVMRRVYAKWEEKCL